MSAGERKSRRTSLARMRGSGSEVASARRSGGQGGFSIVEVVVVVVVAVPVILMGAYGLFTTITASSSTKTRQELEAAISSYSESLKAMPTYTACATALQIKTAYNSWPDRWAPGSGGPIDPGSLDIGTDVRFWDQAAAAFKDRSTPCVDGGAQQIQIKVGHQNGETLSATIVKRDPGAHP